MFKDLIGETIKVHVDDMLVKSKVARDYMTQLGEMFAMLRRYQIKLNPLKCTFGAGVRKIPKAHGKPKRN